MATNTEPEWFRRMLNPPIVITHPGEVSAEDIQLTRDSLERSHIQAGSMVMLPQGMTATGLTIDPRVELVVGWITAESQDEKGFLANILANMDDQAVRQVYADWLDEHNRAEEASFWRL